LEAPLSLKKEMEQSYLQIQILLQILQVFQNRLIQVK